MNERKPLPAKKYLVGSGGGDGSKNGTTKDDKNGKNGKDDSKQDAGGKKSSKKRALDDTLDDTTDANGANEDESNKKLKDAQKASSKKLNIPVDEGCPLIGKSHRYYPSSWLLLMLTG